MTHFLMIIHRFKALLLLGACLASCKCVRPQVSNSANIILKEPLSDEAISERIARNTTIPPNSIKIKRCPCDSALINIALPEDWQFEGQDGLVNTTPKGGGQSGGVDKSLGTIAINRMLSPLEESQFFTQRQLSGVLEYKIDSTRLIPIGKGLKDPAKAISIAIFDSGLDPTFLPGVSWQQSTTLCTPNASFVPATSVQGWNFMNSPVTASTDDDQTIEHGSRGAYFIAKQFGTSPVPVRIVPMKVLGKDNTGDLFGIMCAMETARKNKIEVFNMSLGYYGDRDSVFAEYMKRAVDQGIWIVTAAGNQPNPNEERNLSKREKKSSFYPAFFSKEPAFDRVIAVTTIDSNKVCPSQNYDPTFVVGVQADSAWRFRLVKDSKRTGVIGTSYATPIVSGWLGRTLRESGLTGPGITRQKLIDQMTKSAVPGLYQGRYIKRK